jgi:hypothetical protein
VLELWEPDHAFHRIETYLGAVGLVADLYLGYGLGRAQRRTAWADPPEPCRLPLAACRVGGGIVRDSDPHDEIEESWVKARPLLAATGAPRMAEVNA